MPFLNSTAAAACSLALVLMAVTPYHRFTSSLDLVSSGMTLLVFLGIFIAFLFVRLRRVGSAGCLGPTRSQSSVAFLPPLPSSPNGSISLSMPMAILSR